MGRMLDSLRWTEDKPVGEIHAPLHVMDAEEETLMDVAEMPFIEVGPAKKMEASADVMAAPSRLRVVPTAPPPEAAPLSAPASLGERAPLLVTLRPMTKNPVLPPSVRFARDLIAFHEPRHPASEEYRRLAGTLRESFGSLAHVVLCLGMNDDAGNTGVVLNLGITLAMNAGSRVVVVDAAEQRQGVADHLGLRGRPGLAEVLAGTESLERSLLDSGVDNLVILPSGEPNAERPAHLGDAIRPVLRQLRDRFDVVMIDGGAHATQLGRVADSVYLVVPRRHADSSTVDSRSRELLQQGHPLRGSIVTGR